MGQVVVSGKENTVGNKNLSFPWINGLEEEMLFWRGKKARLQTGSMPKVCDALGKRQLPRKNKGCNIRQVEFLLPSGIKLSSRMDCGDLERSVSFKNI